MYKVRLISLAVLTIFLISANAFAQEFKVYGVSLDDSYEQVIKNGVEKEFKVYVTSVPAQFKRNSSVEKKNFIENINFSRIYSTLEQYKILENVPPFNTINYVAQNLEVMKENQKPLTETVCYFGPDRLRVFIFFGKIDDTLHALRIEVTGQFFDQQKKFAQDFKDVFTERYGNPQPPQNFQNDFYWKKGNEIAWVTQTEGNIIAPEVLNTAFQKYKALFDKMVKEQEQKKKTLEDEKSGQRKSLM